jgi:hypothetical protein
MTSGDAKHYCLDVAPVAFRDLNLFPSFRALKNLLRVYSPGSRRVKLVLSHALSVHA